MSVTELANRQPPENGITIAYTSPGGIAVKPFADGYLAMRVCLGHIHHLEDGLLAELRGSREPVPWQNATVREEAIETLRRRARRADDGERSALARLIEHVQRTPYYEDDLGTN